MSSFMCMNPRCNGTDFLCGKCKKLYPSLAAALAQKKRSSSGSGGGQRRSGSNRSFPANNGSVNGRPAFVQQSGGRTVAYTGRDRTGKIVSNDGVNADYVRNDDGTTEVDSQSPDPYNPRPWTRH